MQKFKVYRNQLLIYKLSGIHKSVIDYIFGEKMKLSLKLIADILSYIQNNTDVKKALSVDDLIQDFIELDISSEEVIYHLLIIQENQMISENCINISASLDGSIHYDYGYIVRLTMYGHNCLNALKDKTLFKKCTDSLKTLGDVASKTENIFNDSIKIKKVFDTLEGWILTLIS